jgi:hypothetical protein
MAKKVSQKWHSSQSNHRGTSSPPFSIAVGVLPLHLLQKIPELSRTNGIQIERIIEFKAFFYLFSNIQHRSSIAENCTKSAHTSRLQQNNQNSKI